VLTCTSCSTFLTAFLVVMASGNHLR
jgi:hypothetical protein